MTTHLDVVNSGDGVLSLREAITAANSILGSDVVFISPSVVNNIVLTAGELVVSDDTIISSQSLPLTTIDANLMSRHFQIGPGATVTIEGFHLINGRGGFEGGSINNDGNLTLQTMWLSGNAADFGGAIDNDSIATGVSLTIIDSTLSQNGATRSGGAIFNNEIMTLVNTTISDNFSFGEGGGIHQSASGGGQSLVSNSTITKNRADFDESGTEAGGGISNSGGSIVLDNTIVGGNFQDAFTAPSDLSGTFQGSHNLIGDAASSGGLMNGQSGNIVGLNGVGERIASSYLDNRLQSNGGSVPTHALVASGVAVNAGDDSLVSPILLSRQFFNDARGIFTRFGQGGPDGETTVDIGAYELQPRLLVNTKLDETTNDEFFSLREAIAQSNSQQIGANVGGIPNVIEFQFLFNDEIRLTTGQQLVVDRDVLIRGPGAKFLSIHGDNTTRIFQINAGTKVEISGLRLTGGNGSEGGAINNDGDLTLREMNINMNHASYGGAIDNDSDASGVRLTIVNSTLSQNTATIHGGAIYNSEELWIINSTLSLNSAMVAGGGIVNALATGKLIVTNSTIVGNQADTGNSNSGSGGGINNTDGTVTIHNTILAANFTDGHSAMSEISGLVDPSSSHNIIADAATSGGLVDGKNSNLVGIGGMGTRPSPTIISNALTDNGGPTPTHALVAGSIAIDHGNTVRAVDANGATLLTDQRGTGFRRVLDGNGDGEFRIDIGAVEAPPEEVTGGLVFDQSNGSFRLATVVSQTVNWFQSGSLGSHQHGFIGDFDGDGLLDGMTLNPNNLRFNFFKNNGNGTLANPVSAGTLSSDYTWGNFMVGDFDGDGREEVMGQILSGPVGVGSMRSQNFNGTSQFYIRLATGYEAFVAGDFNGDGIDDILGLFDSVDETRSNIIPIISIGTPVGRRMTAILGSGQFGQSVATGGLHNLVVSDFNGDGRDDIAVLNSAGQTLTASSTGTPRVNAPDARNFIVSNTSPKFLPASYPNVIMTGNFDNDILADLFTIHDAGHLVATSSTLTSNNLPVQTAAVDGTQSGGDKAIIGDFDGNGFDDVVVLGTNAVVFFSTGTTFNPGQDFGPIIGGPIGQIGAARMGRVLPAAP
ncbi:MAG: VCBS repeat-containing protein [Planctomycetaceae bacterium]